MPEPTDADQITLSGLRVLAYCGALPEEQERRQPFELDLVVYADLSAAGASDVLDDTIDYGALARTVAERLAEDRFVLLERMATVVAELALEHPRALAVEVAVRKLRPPLPQDVDTSGVRLVRSRPG